MQHMPALFEAAVEMEPDNYRAMRALGGAVRYAGVHSENFQESLESSLKILRKALELNPDYILTYITISNHFKILALLKNGDSEENLRTARDWLDRAYKKDPENPWVAYSMGALYLLTEEYAKAIEHLEFALTLRNQAPIERDLVLAYNQLAYGYYTRGTNLEEGLELIDKAIAINSEDGIILSTKAELLYKLGRYEEAFRYISKGIRLEPDIEEIQKDFMMIKEALKDE
jgi:tetratricopeptide (TPR) repeat protein